MSTVMVRPSKVKASFAAAGLRTPAGLVAALDRLVCAVVERMTMAEGIGAAVRHIRMVPPLTSEHIRAAMTALESEGVVENGHLLRRARQLAGNGGT